MGLVNRVSAGGNSLGEALALAGSIAENGPRAVSSVLKLIRKGQDLTYSETLDLEEELASALVASGECVHGVSAFLEKRKPQFPDID